MIDFNNKPLKKFIHIQNEIILKDVCELVVNSIENETWRTSPKKAKKLSYQ